LFVTEGAAGRVSRVDPKTGQVTTFASGLPPFIVGIGGAMDVAFIGSTAYVLVTLVGPDVGGSDVVGIYRSTVRTASRSSPTSAPSPSLIHLRPPSSFRLESSTRWKPTAAGSW
jgi:hypothetical protein